MSIVGRTGTFKASWGEVCPCEITDAPLGGMLSVTYASNRFGASTTGYIDKSDFKPDASLFDLALALSRSQHPHCICAGHRVNDCCPRHGSHGRPELPREPGDMRPGYGFVPNTENSGE